MEEIIETFLAEKGQRFDEDGQAIASRERSIVFLPKGVKPDQKVRVKLLKIKVDSRGRMMYRSVSAPVEYTEKWKDNGDGTATRIKVATDWLLQESEAGEIETRELEKREGAPSEKSESKIVWGKDLISTKIEEDKFQLIPLEEEKVEGEKMVWKKTGDREEFVEKVIHSPAKELYIREFHLHRDWLSVDYTGNLIQGYVKTEDDHWVSLDILWQEMPIWWRQEVETRFPICSCGKYRYDAEASDGYQKCWICRGNETCEICGKKEANIMIIGGQMMCASCKKNQEQEQLIVTHLTDAYRQMIVDEAKKLLAGQVLEPELGLAVMKAGLEHISSDYDRDRMLDQWKEYRWYYFTDKGIFGTKFEPAGLKVLQYLSQAVGNSLVEFVAWIGGGAKSSSSDFYLQTQIEGQEVDPKLTEDQLKQIVSKLEAGEPVLADWLRGSEADRTEALAGYHKLIKKLGKDSSQAEEVAKILQDRKQDYSVALEKIWEAKEETAAEERGEVLVNWEGHFRIMGENNQSNLWVINPDGEEVGPSEIDFRKRYTSEGDKRWNIVGPDQLALRWNRWQESRKFFESWEVVKLPVQGITEAQRATIRTLEPHERFNGKGTGFDLTRVGTVTVCVSRERREIPLREFRGADGKAESKPIRCEVLGWDSQVSDCESKNGWIQNKKDSPNRDLVAELFQGKKIQLGVK